MSEMLTMRVRPEQKHALRILAADENLNISEFVLKVLRENTTFAELSLSLASRDTDVHQNETDKDFDRVAAQS